MGMPSTDRHKLRAQKIRLFTILAIVWAVLAGVSAVIEHTTDLNGFAGIWLGIIMAVFTALVVVVLRMQQSREN
jgi:Na+-driven multidrug efflux pump